LKYIISSLAVALLLSQSGAAAFSADSKAQQQTLRTAGMPAFRTAGFSVLALRMNGDTVACVNSKRKMVPASNMKLITTGVALMRLGKNFRFETHLAYDGTVSDGTLKGDLYIVGGADPTTGASVPCAKPIKELFAEWKDIITNAGIKRIEGRIIADQRYFGLTHSESAGWSVEDIGTYYGAGPAGLNFYENAQHFYVTPSVLPGNRTIVRPGYPEAPWMTFINSSVTSEANTPNTLLYINTGFGPYGEVTGSFPVNGGGCTLECDNEFGAYTCAYYFHKYLVSNGVSVSGSYGDISPYGCIRTDLHYNRAAVPAPEKESLVDIGRSLSPTLAEIVKETNRQSDNFFAETLMHIVGKTDGGSAGYETCRTAVERALSQIGVQTGDGCLIFDGSGLSRKNYVSAEFFVKYLTAMTRTSVFPEFLESLACPTDRKSTMSGALGRHPESLRSRIRCKTGSMNGIRCYSGYVLSSDGDPAKTIVFSVLTNNVTASNASVSYALQELLASIAAEN